MVTADKNHELKSNNSTSGGQPTTHNIDKSNGQEQIEG